MTEIEGRSSGPQRARLCFYGLPVPHCQDPCGLVSCPVSITLARGNGLESPVGLEVKERSL